MIAWMAATATLLNTQKPPARAAQRVMPGRAAGGERRHRLAGDERVDHRDRAADRPQRRLP